MGEVWVLQNLWAVNRICKHIQKDTKSSTGLCANSLWFQDNTCARHRTSLYCTYGLTTLPSHTAVLICERPGCT
ncbi:unnamed protein product, partial [Staurois parvus]